MIANISLYENKMTTNLTQMAEGSLNPTNKSRKYGIPYLCIQKINLIQ
jgi:hypothetical protein